MNAFRTKAMAHAAAVMCLIPTLASVSARDVDDGVIIVARPRGVMTGLGAVSPTGRSAGRLPLPNPFRNATAPVVSPDGKHLAFTTALVRKGRGFDAEMYRFQTWISDLRGRDAHPIAPALAVDGACPTWAPDSRSVVVLATKRKIPRIEYVLVRLSLDGHWEELPVNIVPSSLGCANFLDARTLLVERGPQPTVEIWTADLVTGAVSRLIGTPDCIAIGARTSPDGESVSYAQRCARRKLTGIWLLDLTTMQKTQLEQGISGPPAWSPDGTRIAYSRSFGTDEAGNVSVRVFTLATGRSRRIAKSASFPTWVAADPSIYNT